MEAQFRQLPFERFADDAIVHCRTEEEAQSRDYSQIINLSQAGPIALADYTIMNTGSMTDIYSRVDEAISSLLSR